MHIDTLPILHMLVTEYNQLVNSLAIPIVPPSFNNDDCSDLSNLCSSIIDETDSEIEVVEEEILVLLILNSKKRERKSRDYTPRENKKRG